MHPKNKRSERIGINLTPQQHQQLQSAAQRVQKTPASYVYELVRQDLDANALPTTNVEKAPAWVEQIAQLYGLLDALILHPDDSPHPTEQGPEPAGVQPSLHEVNQHIAQAQKTLLSIHHSVVESLE